VIALTLKLKKKSNLVKKFDKLLITSFIPPFIVTFFIALFVFVMQTLWLYIDDIAGKGVGFFLMVELVAYLSVSMIPLALPVAVLISSVMVLGNLAERYELSSMKSAGMSLWRVMKPLMFLTMGIALLSFFCSNYFIPVSNLKFKSRLYDIRQQKPTLSLEESLFNKDFQGFSIRIGDKLPDNRSIKDVLVYDNAQGGQGMLQLVTADSGVMFGTADRKFFVMELYKGHQYVEPKPVIKDGRRNYPLMRATFKSWTKVFDLDEFELDRTDESLFKSHHTMLSNRQLLIAIDSIDGEVKRKTERLSDSYDTYFHFWKKAALEKEKEKNQREEQERKKKIAIEQDSAKQAALQHSTGKDTLKHVDSSGQLPIAAVSAPSSSSIQVPDTTARQKKQVSTPPANLKPSLSVPKPANPPQQQTITIFRNKKPAAQPAEAQKPPARRPELMPWPQKIESDLKDYDSFIQLFPPVKQEELYEKVATNARNIIDQAETALNSISKTKESRVKHVFEFHSKFSMALACFIFLFVGAPMGAIVRKGGFGWPLLISIVFFMLFIIITIFSKNIAERFVIHAVLASWLNCLVVFPMGLVLTYWAMRDTNLTQLMDSFTFKVPNPKTLFRACLRFGA
jgi:lipopolysaccharide export system permease protein